MTREFSTKNGLFSSAGRSLSGFVVAAFGTAPGTRLSGWEFIHSYSFINVVGHTATT